MCLFCQALHKRHKKCKIMVLEKVGIFSRNYIFLNEERGHFGTLKVLIFKWVRVILLSSETSC